MQGLTEGNVNGAPPSGYTMGSGPAGCLQSKRKQTPKAAIDDLDLDLGGVGGDPAGSVAVAAPVWYPGWCQTSSWG